MELFNINDSDENINYYVWNFNDFFKINEDDYYFFYDYVLYEINKDNSYLIIIIPKFEIFDDIINLSFIKKFRFKSFDKNAYEEINYISYKKYLNGRIINTFFMDDHNTLVVLSCFEEEFEINEEANERNIDGRRVSRQISSETYFKLNFNFSFYNHNLKLINYVDGMIFNSFINENTNDDSYFDIWNLFIKSIYLGKQYTMFVYIIEKNLYIYFELIEMNYFIGMKRIKPKKWGKKGLYGFDIYKTLNDFVKIDEMRVAFAFITSYKAAPDTGSSARRNLQNNNRFLIIL